MAAVNLATRPAVAYVGAEGTYGTTPSMTRMTFLSGTMDVSGLGQTEIEADDARANNFDVVDPVPGLKSTESTIKWSMLARPDSTQLTSAASATPHYLGIVAKALIGSEMGADAGSTVAAATSTTTIDVGSGHGSRFDVGQLLGVNVGGTIEPVYVKSISTDTLTFPFALSGSTTNGNAVVNSWTWYPSQSNTQSLAVQFAEALDSAYQWTANGCTGDLEIVFERNGLVKVNPSLKAADWTGPSAQSLTITSLAESMGRPFPCDGGGLCLLQAVSATTRTHVEFESVKITLKLGNVHVPQLTGGVQGTIGVMRVPDRMVCEVELVTRADTSIDSSYWTSRTPLQFVVAVSTGSGTTKRWCAFRMGTCVVVGKPKYSGADRGLMTLKLRAKLDTSTSGSTADNAIAPFTFGVV